MAIKEIEYTYYFDETLSFANEHSISPYKRGFYNGTEKPHAQQQTPPSSLYLWGMAFETLFLTIGLLALGFAGIAIKILIKKDGEFAGTCSSNNPLLNNDDGSCSICGASKADRCQQEELPEGA